MHLIPKPLLYLQISTFKGFDSFKIHDKRDIFNFDIVNFSFLDGDFTRHISYGVYISLGLLECVVMLVINV